MRGAPLLDLERNLIGDGDAVSLQGDDFFGMVGEDSYVLESEVNQNLRADAAFVLHHALAGRLAVELAPRMQMNLRQCPWLRRLINAESATRVMQINKDAAIFLGDSCERAGDQLGAVAGDRAEDIPRQTVRVNAHERGRFPFEIAADSSNVLVVG